MGPHLDNGLQLRARTPHPLAPSLGALISLVSLFLTCHVSPAPCPPLDVTVQ